MIRRIRRLFTTSLRRQLVLGIAMVHALLMTLFVFDLVERQRTFLRQQSEEQALSLSQTLATSSTSWVLANDVVGLEEVLRSLLSYPELRYAMVLSLQGKVLGHSERQLTGKYVVDEVSQRLLHGLPNPTIQVSSPQIIDVAAPILFKEQMIAWARIGLGQRISQERLQLVTLEGLVYTVVAILIGTLFALLMARGLTRGLYQLLDVAEATREGHRGLRTSTERQDELGQLADGFNRMLDALAVKEVSLVQMHHHLETARRQADEANQYLRVSFDKLQQERNKLHTILYSIREGIVLTDAQGTVIMVNPAIEQLLQKKHDQIETEGFFNLVDNPEFVRNCLDHAAEGNSHTLHYKGRELHFYASTFKEHDQAIGTAALIRDVTEEKKLKEQLNEIITKAPFGIIVIDDQGRVRVFNPESSRLFGYTTTEMIGKPITDLIPNSTHTLHDLLFAQRHADPFHEPVSFEVSALHRDGFSFPIRMAANRMILDGRAATVAMIADITEERQLLNDLIQSEKMAGLGNMVAGVAHEINTPIGIGVTSVSELKDRTAAFERILHSEGISEEELHAYLSSTRRLTTLIQSNLERAADLITNFKAVAVDQSNEQSRRFRVRECAEAAVLTLHHEFKNTPLSIHIQCDDTLEIHSDPGALSRIVIALLNNSLIHGFDPGQPGTIRLDFSEHDGQFVFTYEDDGHGMSEETCRRVFEPFYTTRRNQGGSGLGMHVAYNLVVHSLGGVITCQSSIGHGVRFQIMVPLEYPQEESTTPG